MCLKLRFLSSRGLQLLEDAKRQQEAIQMKKAPCTFVQSASKFWWDQRGSNPRQTD